MKVTNRSKKRGRMNIERLKHAREARGWTQQDLADQSNIKLRQIQRYEAGENDPTADMLALLSKALEVSVDYLLGLSDHPHGEITFKDLSPEEQRLITAYRQSTNASERVANIFFALTVDEDLMDELSAQAKTSGN